MQKIENVRILCGINYDAKTQTFLSAQKANEKVAVLCRRYRYVKHEASERQQVEGHALNWLC